jgi:hypothetical protein
MKRMTILVAVAALFASTATIALAGDADEGVESEPETSEARELNVAQMQKVNILADYWLSGHEDGDDPEEGDPAETSDGEPAEDEMSIEDEIEALRTGEIVVGWGAMFKLMQLARLHDPEMSLTDYVRMIKDADEGWAFGRRFKEYSEDETKLARPDDAPKNLGQLKKQDREENGTRHKGPKKP